MSKLVKNVKGAALVEYGILVGLIAVVAILAVSELGSTITGVFTEVNTQLSDTL